MPATLRAALVATLPSYRFAQFRGYPARNSTGWQELHVERLERAFSDGETTVRHDLVEGQPVVLSVRNSAWDSDHFGFGVASINLVHSEESPKDNARCQALLNEALSELRADDVRFV